MAQFKSSEEVVARATTGRNRKFTLPVMPKGKYKVIIERPKNTSGAKKQKGSVKSFNEAKEFKSFSICRGQKDRERL